jgi:hypothetical protein
MNDFSFLLLTDENGRNVSEPIGSNTGLNSKVDCSDKKSNEFQE